MDGRRRALPFRPTDDALAAAMEMDGARLADLIRRFDAGMARRSRHLKAKRLMHQALDLLVEGGTFADAIASLGEAIALVPVEQPCRRTAEMYWLGTNHLRYTSAELADMLGLDDETKVDKRISDLHKHYRKALGRDEPCPCGHRFGHPLIDCW